MMNQIETTCIVIAFVLFATILLCRAKLQEIIADRQVIHRLDQRRNNSHGRAVKQHRVAHIFIVLVTPCLNRRRSPTPRCRLLNS